MEVNKRKRKGKRGEEGREGTGEEIGGEVRGKELERRREVGRRE